MACTTYTNSNTEIVLPPCSLKNVQKILYSDRAILQTHLYEFDPTLTTLNNANIESAEKWQNLKPDRTVCPLLKSAIELNADLPNMDAKFIKILALMKLSKFHIIEEILHKQCSPTHVCVNVIGNKITNIVLACMAWRAQCLLKSGLSENEIRTHQLTVSKINNKYSIQQVITNSHILIGTACVARKLYEECSHTGYEDYKIQCASVLLLKNLIPGGLFILRIHCIANKAVLTLLRMLTGFFRSAKIVQTVCTDIVSDELYLVATGFLNAEGSSEIEQRTILEQWFVQFNSDVWIAPNNYSEELAQMIRSFVEQRGIALHKKLNKEYILPQSTEALYGLFDAPTHALAQKYKTFWTFAHTTPKTTGLPNWMLTHIGYFIRRKHRVKYNFT